MKIFPLAIASLVASATASRGGVRKISKAAASPKLMAQAMKYSEFKKNNNSAQNTPRKLNDEFEITGSYSIVPQECKTFTVYDEDVYDENYIAFTANGKAKAVKSYIVFQVCYTEDCFYEDGGDDMLYIAELNLFMEAAAEYTYAIRANYCEQCEENEEYCGYGDEQNDQQQDQDEEGDDEGRKLKNIERKLAGNYISCSQCEYYNCFQEEGNEQDDPEELAFEKIQDISGCGETGLYADLYYGENDGDRKLNDEAIELNAGFICADGVAEVALFLDDECTIYYSSMDYYDNIINAYNDNGEDAVTEDLRDTMYTMMQAPFAEGGIDCKDFPEFDDPYEEEEDNQDEEDENQANEVCENIMDAEAVPLYGCGQDNNDEQEEEEENEQQEGNQYNFEWTYELTENQAEDIGLVCKFYNEYDFEHDYVEQYEGETHFDTGVQSASTPGLSTGAKAAIAIVVLAIVGGVAAFFFSQQKKKTADKDYRLEPLHGKGTSA